MNFLLSVRRYFGATFAMLMITTVGAAAQTVFTSTDTPLRIPFDPLDPLGTLGPTTSTITVPDGFGGRIADVNVQMDFDHTYFSDLTVNVISPIGTTVRLFTNVGDEFNPSGTYTFDDDAAALLAGETTGGTFLPEDALSAFNGESADGIWQLFINDDSLLDTGNLYWWSLILTFFNLNQDYVTPTLQAVVAEDTREVIGTLQDRMAAAFGTVGLQGAESNSAAAIFGADIIPDADVTNPYMGGQWGTWIRVVGSHAEATGAIQNLLVPGSSTYDADLGFVQGGVAAQLGSNGTGDLIGSVFGHYSASDVSVSDGAGALQGTIDTDSGGVGVSLTWLMTSGFYADLVGLASWHDIDTNSGGAVGSTNGDTVAVSMELGYNYRVNNSFSIIPQAQLVYQDTSIDDFVDSAGVTQTFTDADSVEGRIGVAFEHVSAMQMINGVMKANALIDVLHDFENDSSATVDGLLLGFDAEGTELRVGGGLTFVPGAGNMQFGLQGDYEFPLNDEAREGYSVEASAVFRF